jgi:RNA-binding protein
MELIGKQKRFLRGMGHGLRPALTAGKPGLTAELMREPERCLDAHELVEVKVPRSRPSPSAAHFPTHF